MKPFDSAQSRPLMRLVARLYPRAWRDRYGAEFDALIDDLTPRWRDVFNILSGALLMQFSRLTLVPVAGGLLGALAGGIAMIAMPTVFASSSVVQVKVGEGDPAAQTGAVIRSAIETALAGSPVPKERIEVLTTSGDNSVVRISTNAETPQGAQQSTQQVIQALIEGNLRAQEGGDAQPVTMRVLEIASLPEAPERESVEPLAIGTVSGLVAGAALALIARRRTRSAT